ncbi:hypothetical protein P7H25_05015 [Paenibacillus larvae]|nr:hypothetical protein [Paenibacillus larvae]MDT2255124.1 hypothetical protein [Paenibacillus larvae]
MTAERFLLFLGGWLSVFSLTLFKNPYLQLALIIVLFGYIAWLERLHYRQQYR